MPKSIVRSEVFSPLAQSRPVAARAGEFLFLSGQTPHNPETGELVTSIWDIKDRAKGILDLREYESLFDRVIPGPVAAQTFTILANIEAVLSENGMSMEHIVKANIYISDFQDLAALHRVWKKFFPKATAACSVVGISKVGMNPKIRVIIDCIAALPEKISPGQIQRFPSDKPHIGLGECAAVRAGDLIFVSGHVGVDAEGKAILKCAEVAKEAQAFIQQIPMATIRTEATVAQIWSINKQINDLLEKMGSSGDNILTQNYFARTMTYEFFNTLPVNEIFYPESPPAASGFGYPTILGNDDLYIEVEVIATIPGRKEVFNFGAGLTKPTTHYSMATKAGQYIFLSGRAGINWQKNGDPVVLPSDLDPWNGQHIMVGRIDQEKPVFLQAWYCYEAIRKIVEQTGATMDDIVKTNVFVMDVEDLPLVERARNYFFKDAPPVETVIPMTECTMHKELVVEVEPIIVIDA
ncbi:MAG: RidA family protein [Deltaproteobacteria bacterium]|nr:RidA family protein [Deltaproteobacteria bacterium]